MALENSQLIRRWFDQVWNQGRADVIDQMSHPQTKGYGQAEHGRQIDMDEFKKLWSGLRSAFPDIHVTIHDTIEQGEKVAARWTATMTHKGEFLDSHQRAARPPSPALACSAGRMEKSWKAGTIGINSAFWSNLE